jgi:deoxyribonuclease-4
LLNLCTELEGVGIGMDFAHWHARSGGGSSYPEFASVLQQIKQRLGDQALDNMHIHVSGIAYGKKGEIKHLNLPESDFKYVELLRALKDFNARGLVICESPNLEGDALLLQETYNSL